MSEFDQSISDLVALCKEILNYNSVAENPFATQKEKSKKKIKNPILKCLERYKDDYDLSDEEGNKEDVVATYKKIKVALLKGHKFDEWLKNGEVNIFSGSIEPDKDRRMMLSAIYLNSCRIRDQVKSSLTGLPVEAYELKKEILHPAKFQLYMYRVFLFSLSGQEAGEDITKIAAFVSELEKELKISPVGKEGTVAAQGIVPQFPGMDGMLGFVKDMMAKSGIQMPEGAQGSFDPSSMVQEVMKSFNSPEVSKVFGEVTESLKGSRDIGDVFSKVMTKMSDPGMQEKLMKIVPQSLGMAMPTPAENPKSE